MESWACPPQGAAMIMDRAYEGDETRQLERYPENMNQRDSHEA